MRLLRAGASFRGGPSTTTLAWIRAYDEIQ